MPKVVVTCFERFGNIVPGANVSLKLQTGTTLTGTTSVATNAQGQALFTNLSVGLAGTYSFLASVVNTSGFTPLGVYQPVIAPQTVTQASTNFTISENTGTTRIRKR
ncbi:MAG TPA: hypothetical protein VNX28_10515 [Gemmataceae bacterium]|jgi:hypothetical protein|nr:hypothetical protein [Gemmataceae bacterium]